MVPSGLDIPPFLALQVFVYRPLLRSRKPFLAPSFSVPVFFGATVAVTLRSELTHGSRFPSFFLEFLVG